MIGGTSRKVTNKLVFVMMIVIVMMNMNDIAIMITDDAYEDYDDDCCR
jgi:hypothetical protein